MAAGWAEQRDEGESEQAVVELRRALLGSERRLDLLLGAFPEPSWRELTVHMQAGSTFLAYTDGVTELARFQSGAQSDDSAALALRPVARGERPATSEASHASMRAGPNTARAA